MLKRKNKNMKVIEYIDDLILNLKREIVLLNEIEDDLRETASAIHRFNPDKLIHFTPQIYAKKETLQYLYVIRDEVQKIKEIKED